MYRSTLRCLRSSLNSAYEFPILDNAGHPERSRGTRFFRVLDDTLMENRFLAAARNDDVAGFSLETLGIVLLFSETGYGIPPVKNQETN
jgi:hypothetical protein